MRLTTLAAFGVGFVLGSRAGKERYEQIKKVARRSAGRLEAFGADSALARRLENSGRS